MKNYSKMTAAVINLAEMLDEAVAERKAVPALAGVGGNIHMAGRFGLSNSGTISKDDTGTEISMIKLS